MNIRSNTLGYIFITPTVLFIAIFMLYPIFVGISFSFYDMDLTNGLGNFPFIGLKNYINLFKDEIFFLAVKNSLIFVSTSVGFHLTMGFILALALDKKKPGRLFFRTINIIPWAISGVCAALLWVWLFHPQLGAINDIFMKLGFIQEPKVYLSDPKTAMLAVMIAHNWRSFPFAFIILLAGLQMIPLEHYEAADMDGASPIQKFIYITFPQMISVILAVFLLDFLWTFVYFDMPWAMTQGGPINATQLMTTYVYELSFGFFYFGKASAQAVFVFIINLVFSLIYIFYSTRRAQ